MQKIKLIFPVLVVTVFSLPPLPSKVEFKSLESKIENDQAVFNQIWLEEKNGQDIWIMNQSHNGLNYDKDKWDQVKIIVNKTKMTASFHQLKNGKDIPLKVDCNLCHSNGPRAINPDLQSVKIKERIKIWTWNMKIKTYGTLKQKHSSRLQHIKNETCLKCHNDGDNFWERSKLKKENFLAIEYLIKNNLMPPWPYKLSEIEKNEILKEVKRR